MSETAAPKKTISIFMVAGEPSGDVLGARLMIGLRSIYADMTIEFHGVGGPLMAEQGLESLFPMDELTVMGIAEVLPQLPNLLKRIQQTAQSAINVQPDAFITIDAPDFSFRVAKKLKASRFSKIHYVAPSVWAWRAGRAKKLAALYDRVLTLLPFEPAYFEKEGMSADFVGHSIIESGAAHGNSDRFREKYDISDGGPVLMILPGSRRSEVSRHLPIFKATLDRILKQVPKLQIVIPVVGKSALLVEELVKNWPVNAVLVKDHNDKYDAMAASDGALAASGTVGLELALAKLPCVIAYKMHPLTSYLARRLIKLKYVNLVNILEDNQVVPEYLLEDCLPENLAPALIELLQNERAKDYQINGYKSAVSKLECEGVMPGVAAARAVKQEIESSS